MPQMPFLRYLRRPAALRIVSSETPGSRCSLSHSPTRLHSIAFGSVACVGTPWGYTSLTARSTRSREGFVLLVAPASLC
jgi:hypothetical protein